MHFLPRSDPELKAKQQKIFENIYLKNNMIVISIINIQP